ENIEEYLDVPDVIGGGGGDYILRGRGGGMIEAGILDGGFVVGGPPEGGRGGGSVVGLFAAEGRGKRFFREKGKVPREAEKKSMKPIRTRDARLLGRVVGVFRTVS